MRQASMTVGARKVSHLLFEANSPASTYSSLQIRAIKYSFSIAMESASIQPLALRAAIHVGANSISMLITSSLPNGDCVEVDFLEQSAPIAPEIFRKGKISRPTIEKCVTIIQGYHHSLKELGGTSETPIRMVTTNILSEATNHDTFLNRIRVGCGHDLEVLDDGEMTRLIYLKTRRRLKDTPSMQKCTTLVVHAGPGNTRSLLFRNGNIVGYSAYRLGTYRSAERLDRNLSAGALTMRILHEQNQGSVSSLYEDYKDAEIQDLLLIGYEVQCVASHLISETNSLCSVKKFRKFTESVAALTMDERVRKFQIDYYTAESLVAALEINLSIAEAFHLKELRISTSDYERGLLHDLPISSSLTDGFKAEVINSAWILAKKYRVHEAHAIHVSKLALKLYKLLQELHQLSDHDELLLHSASILHECGGFVSPKAHHKHSFYIIQNSEIFGLGKTDLDVVSLVARYHRQSAPKSNHAIYKDLSKIDRMRVSKLAAILRLADSLDRSHSRRVEDLTIKISRRKLHIYLPGITDASIERIALASKGDLFEDIFGLGLILHEEQS